MRAAYIGIDLLYPALPALEATGCEILKIFTCETDNITEFNRKVCAFATSRNIPIQTARITENDILELEQEGCELILCAAYYYKVPISKKIRMVNIHPALLPEGRGAWPMPVQLLRRHQFGGVTFHKMTERFDDGEILMQKRVEILPGDNLETLTVRLCEQIPCMVKQLIADMDTLFAKAKPQANGSYWACPSETEYILDASMSVEEAELILRAFYGYECWYRRGDKIYVLQRALAHSRDNEVDDLTKKKKQDTIASDEEKVHNKESENCIFRLKDGYVFAERVNRIISMNTEAITFQTRERIETLRKRYQHNTASHAFISLYIWKQDLELSVYIDDELYAVAYGLMGENTWYFPCGSRKAVTEFLKRRMEKGKLTLYGVREEDKCFLEEAFPGRFTITERADDSEYLYDRVALQQMKGRKYANLRNHINRIKKEHAVEYRVIDEKNIIDVQRIASSWTARADSEDGITDTHASETLVAEWKELGIYGVVVSVDKEPYAVVAGYPISDTVIDMSFAKQKAILPGLGVYAKQAFVSALPEQYTVINAEDDMGLQGLRMMKKQMHPMAMIHMYKAELKDE